MRITVVGPSHPLTGGVVAHTAELVHRLRAGGDRASLLTWDRTYPAVLHPARGRGERHEPDVPPVPDAVRTLRWDRPWRWAATGRAAARDADVVVLVHVMAAQAPALRAVAAGVRAAGTGTRVVVLAHNVLPHERHALDRWLVRGLLRAADHVLVHTTSHASQAAALGARRTDVLELPLHLPRTGTVAGPRRLHEERGGGRLRVLFAGHVRGYKGVDVLLDAVAATPGAELTVAGEAWGRARRDLARRAADPALRGRVLVRDGYVPAPELGDLLTTHDVLVLPYRSASGSQNVDLAFAHGLPVVASDLPTFAARVRHGVDGLLVRSGDSASLAAALRALQVGEVLEHLASGVVPPDVDAAWEPYLSAVRGARDGLLGAAAAPGPTTG